MANKYSYKRWGGGTRTVEADSVEFGPAHVIFRTLVDGIYRIVLAERIEQVNELQEIE